MNSFGDYGLRSSSESGSEGLRGLTRLREGLKNATKLCFPPHEL
jgi:hypothetical protein